MNVLNITDIRKVDNMSFCGMFMNKEGILAFADSKATKLNCFGNEIEDKKRNPQKLFKSSNVILITCGNNYILNNNQETEIEIKLKQIIKDYDNFVYYNNSVSITFLIMEIVKLCRSSIFEDVQRCYQFVIGYIEDSIYHLCYIKVANNETITQIIPYKNKKSIYYYVGNEKYINLFKNSLSDNMHSLEEFKTILEQGLTKAIEYFDISLEYNPVGLPINIDVFK